MYTMRIEKGPIEDCWKIYDIRGNHYLLCTRWKSNNELHVSLRYSNDVDHRLPKWAILFVEPLPSMNHTAQVYSAYPKTRENGRGTKISRLIKYMHIGKVAWTFDYGKLGDCNNTWDVFIKYTGSAQLLSITLETELRTNWYKRGDKERKLVHEWAPIQIPFKTTNRSSVDPSIVKLEQD